MLKKDRPFFDIMKITAPCDGEIVITIQQRWYTKL